jgi:formylglycine-generating enzyme required for sulfatase activity
MKSIASFYLVSLLGLVVASLSAAPPAAADTNRQPVVPPSVAGVSFVWVEKGDFWEGADNFTPNPRRKTSLPDGFWISRYEVTQESYREVMRANPSQQVAEGHPVENVSWHDATEFCRRLTEELRTRQALPNGSVVRLPTAAEWEYAARGGPSSKGHLYAGGGVLAEISWSRNESPDGHRRVGTKQPNELGLHDMTGNVWEWCIDALPADRTGKPGVDTRIKRGGSFNNQGPTSLITNIGEMGPAEKGQRFGFRVVLARPHVTPAK